MSPVKQDLLDIFSINALHTNITTVLSPSLTSRPPNPLPLCYKIVECGYTVEGVGGVLTRQIRILGHLGYVLAYDDTSIIYHIRA